MRTRYPRRISAIGRPLLCGLLTGFLLTAGPLVAQPTAGRAAAPPATDLLLALRNAPPTADRQQVLREKLQLTAADEMRLLRTETDELGFVHERFQPYYRGVKVEHASISLHERGGRIETLSGTYVHPAAGLSARPALTEAAALQRALAAVGARTYKWQVPGEEAALKQQTGNPRATYQPHGELVWVGDFRQPEANRPVVLAWKYNIYAADPVSRAWVYVDANTGQEVFRNAIIKHVNAPGAQFATRYVGARTSITDNTGSRFRLRETATGKGVTTLNLLKTTTFGSAIDFTDNDNNWTAAEFDNANFDNAGLDAHLGAQATQGYWNTIHGRDSYDDKGTVLLSYVHYGNGTDNAFWNGTAMLYGDGSTLFKPLTAIDVCGHEIGHAVCESTANLTYSNESGAMNEGFSDIWGCAVENFFDPTKQKYLIGEDICLPSFGTALRSMSNPNQFGQPDTYLGTNWATGSGDNGGVHTNSGVLNFWFYLLSNGGSGTNDKGTAFNVTGISIAKAEKIAYRTERIYLTASSNYAACRKASMQAAIDLYGLGSAEVQSTAQAWRAVGVGTTTGAAEAAPTITGFTPTSGLAGTVVTITGTNLGATMLVTFNGVNATIATLTSATSLTVTVPPGASTGLISLSTAAGTVTTSGLSPANFTITAAGAAPVITSFSPAGGQVQGGAVTITGTALTGATAVSFNGTAATILTNTATTITTTVPAGATSGPLTVTTANGTATAPTTFTVLPNIISFSPGNGAVGASVVLTGTTFTGALDVKFNGVYATYTVNSATQITATVPNGATTGPITVRTPSGTATSATNFTVNATLAFTSFSPTSGAVTTTVVNIKGRGFTGTSAITFGGVNAPTFTVASDLELFVTVPVGAITGNIVLTTPLGPATSPVAFTVTAPLVPTITSFTPASGVVGDAVTITGTNFTGATAVTFNGTSATFTVSSSTTIFTTVPVGATTGVIRVTVPGGTATSASNFSVVLPGAPTITSFTPAVGNTGTVVTLTGTNFTGTTDVAFNGTAAAFTLVSSTVITTTAPAGGTTGQISVTNGFGTGLSATSFFYPPTNDLCANTGLPVLACGGSVSGTTISSTSTGDPTGTCGTTVQATAGGVFYRFVGTGGSVTMTTCAAGTNYDTKLFVFTGTCGSYTCVTGNDDVTSTCSATGNTTPSIVTFPSVAGTNYFVFVSGFNSNQGNFTLTATCVPVVPTITSFTPTSGPVGTSVAITGTNLTAASAVTFNGTAATTFTVNSATSITATVPAGATTGPIGVTVPGGSGVSGTDFTVLVAPTLTSLTPNSGLVGASITLSGTDFTGATGISFNGTAAVTFSVTNATTATATVPVGTTTGNVTITTPGGTSNGVVFTILGPPVITALNPTRNLRNAARTTSVAVTFDQAMSGSAGSVGAVKVFSQQRGGRMSGAQGGTASVSGSTITFNPATDFQAGETVLVTTTTAAQSSAGATLVKGAVHQFTAATGGTGVGVFGTATAVSGGNTASHVSTGDLNADGRPDLLWTNYGTTTVGVALATGPTTYAPATSVTVAGNPVTAALADFDGDGDLDFVTANYGNPAGTGANLSVGLNNGTGTFAVATVTTATGPRWVTPADVDADGDLDLLVPVGTGVQIYANNGSGAFALLNTVSGINFAIAALGADVDGDGDIDLLTSNYFQGNTVSVRLNNGTGTFSGSQNVAVGTQPFHLAVGDVDGDGDLDFVTANQGAGTASVRLNTGGTFAPPAIAANGEVTTGAGTSIVALGDVDADGDLDVVASSNSGAVVRLNDGNGVFSAPASSGTLAGGFVALTDMDNDGDLDLATATGGTTVTVSLNQGPAPTLTSLTPTSGLVGASITLAGTNFTGATGVSFNGTAATTFSVTNATTATATVPVGATSGNVTITTPSGTSNGVAFTVVSLTITALAPTRNLRNAPAVSNVAVTFSQPLQNTAATQQAVKVFSQQRGGRMSGAQGGAASVSSSTITFNPTNDFRPGETVFVTTTTAATGTGGGTLARGQVHQFTAAAGAGPGTFGGGTDPGVGSNPRGATVGDVDNDGDLDLLAVNTAANTVSVRLNNGSGTFSGSQDVSVGPNPFGVVVGDVDGDGDLDLLTVNNGANAVSVRLNNGSGTFAGGSDPGAGGSLVNLAVGDVDGDGDLDLLTVSDGGAVIIRLNGGDGAGSNTGTFSNGSSVAVGSSPQSVAVGDVDGDGDLDLVTANSFASAASVRLNGGDASGSNTGIFSGGSECAAGATPRSVALGDVDGDGDLDLLVANQSAGTVSVRLNNGSGTFSGGADPAVGTSPRSVALGDVDGDGDLDLLTANLSSSTVSVRLNNGNGTFAGGSDPGVGSTPLSVALADVDGDGDLDLYTANTGANSVSVRFNQPPAPTLTSLSPTSASIGASITLTGTNFTGATGVSFNGTAATTFSVSNATTATATVPVGATSGNVTITTPSGTSNGVAFTVITNQAPTALGLSPQSVAENTPGGSAIGNFSTTDPDAGNTFSYSLVAGTGSADNGAFSISGSQLVITSAPDFETKSSYAIRVRTTDQGSLFFEQTFTITVTNVNEAPGAVTDANGATNTVAENAANTTTVGITATATDPDAGASLSYSLTDNAGGRFTINSSSGVVTVANGSLLDFEAATSHSITVQVSDGSLTSSQSFTITVTNVNETPSISPQTFSTAENVPNGNLVGLVVASDPDASTTLTYSITAGNTGGAFSFNASTNQLQVANSAAVNFETNPTFSLTVQVSDGSLTSSATVTVNLTNVNEAPGLSPQTFSVDENSAAGTVVGIVVASDPDAGTSLTYSIIGGNTGAAFTFVGNQLRVQFSGTLDFETLPTYSLTVRVTDGSLFANATVTVNLNDLSEAPTAVSLAGQSVPENQTSGTSVGSLSTTGPGSGYTYALVSGAGSTGNAAFTIVGDLLQTAAVFDFETQNSYAIRIRSTDTGNGGEFLEQTFTISVTNLNDAPTALGLSPQSVAENTPGGSAIGNFSTTDADAGNTHTYALVSGTGSTDNGAFSISGNQLLITASPDFETQASYAVRVRTTDQFGLTFEQPFTITVTNVNEAPILTIQGRSIPENSLLSAPVGAPIPATDPDAGTTLTYSITAGNTGGAFSFSGNQLQVANAAALDFETTPTFSLTVQVSDGSLTASNTVTVNLTNVNEAPTALALSNATIAENTGANVVVGQLTTTDPDAANTFTYTLVSGSGSTDNALVNLNGNEVRITASPDFETKASYAIRLRTTDQGGLAFERAFTLTITDVFESPANDAPTNIFLSNANVAENAANATVGLLTTADGDVADTHTYTLVSGAGSTGNAAFVIVGDELRVGATALDFETQASYPVRIRTTDNGTGNLFFEKAFTVTVTDVAEPLTVSTIQNVPAGLYSTITVTPTGIATLSGAVVVNGNLTVQAGGRLNTACQPITGPGSFTLAAGATLAICDPAGISLSGPTGAVQLTGARAFAADAIYIYNGIAAQVTGNGLPAAVRELEAANPGTLTLTQPAAVTHVLRLSAGTLVTNDLALTLRSSATRTAYAVHAGGLTSGNVTVQRYIGGPTAAGYRHLSAPVVSTPVSDLTTPGYTPLVNPAYNNLPYVAPPAASFPNVFGFDETRGGTNPTFAGFGTGYYSPTTTGATLTPGRGWSVFMSGAKTPDFVGALTTGNVPMTLTVTGTNSSPNTQKAGWHLLGDPYAQPIDWDLATVPEGMSSSISVFRTTGGNNGIYLTRANGTGSLPNGEIAVGQAFFARATVHNTVFTFTNALRVEANPGPVARPVLDARPMVRLTLASTAPDAVADETLLYAEAGATTGEDLRFDGLRPGRNTGNVPTLASLIDGQEAAVNGLSLDALTTGTTVVELTAALPTAGAYTLAVAELANLPATTTVVLLDRLTNTRYDLRNQATVTLTAAQANTVQAGRWAVVFNGQRPLGTSNLAPGTSNLTLFPNPATGAEVRVAGAAPGEPLTLLDATGRAVARVLADATGAATLPTAKLAAGVYTLRAGGAATRLVVE